MSKATQRDHLVTIEGVPGTWRNLSGGGGTVETTKDRDGGAIRPDILGGPPEFEDLECARTFDPVRDAAWMKQLRQNLGRGFYTVMKQPIDVNKIAIGEPLVYPDCMLSGLTEAEVADSSDPAEVSLTFSTTGPAD